MDRFHMVIPSLADTDRRRAQSLMLRATSTASSSTESQLQHRKPGAKSPHEHQNMPHYVWTCDTNQTMQTPA